MARNGKFLIGAILGALFGLAFAPKKGSEFRKELKTEISKGGHGEKTLKKTASMMGQDIADTAKEVYDDPAVQGQLKKGKKEAEKMLNKTRENLEHTRDEWVGMARSKINESQDMLEKEANKAFDTLKKKVTPKKEAIRNAVSKKVSSVKKKLSKNSRKK